jgi:hypothetical protein
MRLQKRVVSYEDVSIDADELVTVEEASDLLGISIASMRYALTHGFTEIVDVDTNTYYALRSEINRCLVLQAHSLVTFEELEATLNAIFKGETP